MDPCPLCAFPPESHIRIDQVIYRYRTLDKDEIYRELTDLYRSDPAYVNLPINDDAILEHVSSHL